MLRSQTKKVCKWWQTKKGANGDISDYTPSAAKLNACCCHKGIHSVCVHSHGWNVKVLSSLQTKQLFLSVINLGCVSQCVSHVNKKQIWYDIFQVRHKRFTAITEGREKQLNQNTVCIIPLWGGSLQLVFGFLNIFSFLLIFPH